MRRDSPQQPYQANSSQLDSGETLLLVRTEDMRGISHVCMATANLGELVEWLKTHGSATERNCIFRIRVSRPAPRTRA